MSIETTSSIQPAIAAYQSTTPSPAKKAAESTVREEEDNSGKTVVRFEAYGWQSETYEVKAKNSDGDSWESSGNQYSSAGYSVTAEVSGKGDLSGVFSQIESFLKDQEEKMAKLWREHLKGSSPVSLDPTATSSPTDALVPEYWNAENTSERIFQFATQFYEASGLSKEEYTEKITAAIKRGYKDARDMLGNLDPATSKLLEDTHQMTLDKVAKWAAQPDETSPSQVQA